MLKIEKEDGFRMQHHYVTVSDGTKIAYRHIAQGHDNVIVIAHGFYNSKEALLLKELAQELSSNFDVVILDFRGHGKSSGLFHWTSKEPMDLMAVIDAIKEGYTHVGVIGFSLGAATTLISASHTKTIGSVMAISPPADFDKIEYRLWELDPALDLQYSLFGEGRIGKGVRPGPWWLKKEKPIDAVSHMTQPVYFIHGTKDWIIKPWHSQKLFEHCASQIKKIDIIEGAPHAEYMMLTHKEWLLQAIHKWFKETL